MGDSLPYLRPDINSKTFSSTIMIYICKTPFPRDLGMSNVAKNLTGSPPAHRRKLANALKNATGPKIVFVEEYSDQGPGVGRPCPLPSFLG